MNRATFRRIAAAAVLLTPLSGCLSDKPDRNLPDPLTGLPRRLPPSERAVASTFGPERTDAAILASAGTKPADSSGLGIRDDRRPGDERERPLAASGAWSGSESKSNAGPGMGARLGGAPAAPPTPPPTGTGAAVRVRSFEEAQQFLTAHGVKWQDLQTTGEGEWKYSCSIPNKANPSTMRTYEGRDRYGLTAIQQVIDQIVRDQIR